MNSKSRKLAKCPLCAGFNQISINSWKKNICINCLNESLKSAYQILSATDILEFNSKVDKFRSFVGGSLAIDAIQKHTGAPPRERYLTELKKKLIKGNSEIIMNQLVKVEKMLRRQSVISTETSLTEQLEKDVKEKDIMEWTITTFYENIKNKKVLSDTSKFDL